jgi:hypothetical protein
MFLERSAENYYVIEVGNAYVIPDPIQAVLHKPLKLRGRILEAEGHSNPLVQPPGGNKSGLVLVFWVYKALVVGFALVEERKPGVSP